jgi:hypothetical protein
VVKTSRLPFVHVRAVARLHPLAGAPGKTQTGPGRRSSALLRRDMWMARRASAALLRHAPCTSYAPPCRGFAATTSEEAASSIMVKGNRVLQALVKAHGQHLGFLICVMCMCSISSPGKVPTKASYAVRWAAAQCPTSTGINRCRKSPCYEP